MTVRMDSDRQSPLIVFDGQCRLCNGSVAFVSRRDPDGRFRYLPFESQGGRIVCEHFGLAADDLESFVLIDNAAAYFKSDAWIHILARLHRGWRFTALLLGVVPKGVRDHIYDLIGRHRTAWFGRVPACPWPLPDDDKHTVSAAQVRMLLECIDERR